MFHISKTFKQLLKLNFSKTIFSLGRYDPSYEGILLYIKSSLKALQQWEDNEGAIGNEASGFNYKINHPSFPHESTIDQFFDPYQWNAYYFLGRQITEDIFFKSTNNNIEYFKSFFI